ncbi:GntR family transcriptional regulator [Alkalihalobacillus trypoxylicola]|uniref:Transcriptional regulator n=1 Tax=Alkalihalobacillus trypoxylicola TaxID=519424 RepID=A0A162EVX6_9BACI|nr:GntR family transcriptional regulator [Alkalihalobacillus trypoxylicola]KYG33864.1 transcriptional regulator [Alkalihalobacillus trypoxylicola]
MGKSLRPSYMEIRDKLFASIEKGEFCIGDQFPSEIEMAKSYGVSRETFRSAVKVLEKEGRVVVKRGVGTFVTTPLKTIPSSLEKLTSITDIIRAASLQEGDRSEQISEMLCEPEWAENLQVKVGDPVILHERIRTADGEPVVFSLNIIPRALIGDAFEKKEFSGSLLQFIEKHCRVKIEQADTEIVVPLHTDRYCQKLLVHPHTTVLLMKQVHYDEINRPVFYSIDYLRNDVFKFMIRRKR